MEIKTEQETADAEPAKVANKDCKMTQDRHNDFGKTDRLVTSVLFNSLMGNVDRPEIIIDEPSLREHKLVPESERVAFAVNHLDLCNITSAETTGDKHNPLGLIRVTEFHNRFTVNLFDYATIYSRMTVYKGSATADTIARLMQNVYTSLGNAKYEEASTRFSDQAVAAASQLAEYLRLTYISYARPDTLLYLMRSLQTIAHREGADNKIKELKAVLGIQQ